MQLACDTEVVPLLQRFLVDKTIIKIGNKIALAKAKKDKIVKQSVNTQQQQENNLDIDILYLGVLLDEIVGISHQSELFDSNIRELAKHAISSFLNAIQKEEEAEN